MALKQTLVFIWFITIFSVGISQPNEAFFNKFKEVKLHLANHQEELAIPILEQLRKENPGNANIAYLLGYCYVKKEENLKKAINLLEKASRSFSPQYDPTSLTETKVSEYVFYYLIIAYSLNNQCDKAKETLNKFYEIYSYYDEWYLVEGQKWLRECGSFKPKEDTLETTNSTTDTIFETNSNLTDSSLAQLQQTQEEPNFKDRLTLVSDTTEKQTYQANKSGNLERNVVTKNVSYSTSTILYGVQVAAYLEPKFTKDFANIKNVEAYIDQNGVFRYVIGRFPYRQQAERLLEYVKEAGYSDAFIVDINGQKYAEEVVSINNESIKRQIIGKVDFRVQIGAYKFQIPEYVFKQYLMFDKIKETRVGEFTVLTIGSFETYEQAAEFRDKIQQIGVEDAFIVAFNYDKKIPLDEAETFLTNKRLESLQQNPKKKRKRQKASKK